MARTHYDMAIIGGGSGGLVAARIATSLGARVVLIDKQSLGGDCLHYGCIPSKSLMHVAKLARQAKEAISLGIVSSHSEMNIAQIMRSIQYAIEQVADTEQIYVKGVEVKFGHVSFAAPTTLRLNDEEITVGKTIIATGSRPAIPAIEGIDETGYLTNEDAFELGALPRDLLIAGGGPIGVELGQAFARLGSHVTIIQRRERLLPKEDPEVSELLRDILRADDIDIITNARIIRTARKGLRKIVTVQQGEHLLTYEGDELLLALGRRPNVEQLNLEALGISYDDHGIKVDEYLRTSVPHVFAIGDIIGGYRFTHVASFQAGIAVRNALLPLGKKKVDYRVVPWCTFTDPEVARIGLTPAEAKERYKQVRVISFPCSEIDRAQTEHDITGFIKLVLAGKKDEIVGAHIVGMHAGELLGELSLAMRHHLTISNIYNTIHAYPTMATGLQQAAFEAYLSSKAAANNRRLVSGLLRLHR